MNPNFASITNAAPRSRALLFNDAARRLGTSAIQIEKDFWVCWLLDLLFNDMPAGGPRLLFKGGTSLSKAFGLIERFSEDIDLTVFREDLGQGVSAAELAALSNKKRKARLAEILTACRDYLRDPFLAQVDGLARAALGDTFRLEFDPSDADGQTLLFWYPGSGLDDAPGTAGGYIQRAVKIESGARSALLPHVSATVRPYLVEVVKFALDVPNVTTVAPERTFWDKVVILHGLHQWFERRGQLRHGGSRISRHYYDAFALLTRSAVGNTALADVNLGQDCVQHASMFFGSPDLGLDLAAAGQFTVMPADGMLEDLAKDYRLMGGMIFGAQPAFDEMLTAIRELQARLDALQAWPVTASAAA